jgi:prepilin-type N-terminal cleavage/methylation domain-containing protein
MRLPRFCAVSGGLRPPTRRAGFTLLEVMLSMSIGVLLLGALYVAVDTQLHHAQAGRDLVEQSKLARTLLARISVPISNAINLPNSSRDSSPKIWGLSSSTASAAQGGAASGTGTTGTTSSSPTGTQSTTNDTITIPFGVQGDSGQLSLYISKVDKADYYVSPSGDIPPPVSDTRRITYWLASGGLARQEVKIITSQDITNLMPPNVPDDGYIIEAAEVRSLTFSYWDGSTWQDSWDSTTLGTDGVTPIGPPRAVQIMIGLAKPGSTDDTNLTYHRHVVGIATANGTTISNNGTVTDYGVVGGTTTNAYSSQ